jgi:hypothetical protein
LLAEISIGGKMRPIILVAILLLSLFLVPMTLALQQSLQIPKITLTRLNLDSGCQLCGAITKSTEPGSGGGGQGVI